MKHDRYRDGRLTPRILKLESLESRIVPTASPVLDLSGLRVDSTQAMTGHILVQFKSGQVPVTLPGTSLGQSFDFMPGLYEVRVEESTPIHEVLAAYRADPSVELAELDHALTTSWVPNDASFAQQWHLRNTGQNGGATGADIGGVTTWSVTTGLRRMPIAVIDSGIDYTHPDLYLNIWINQREIPNSRLANLIDTDRDGVISFRDLNDARNQGIGKITDLNGNGYIDGGDLLQPMVKDASGKDTGRGGWADGISQDNDKYVDDLVGWNFFGNNNRPFDDFGHGTHIAGTIGAVGNNGTGVTGVNWQVQLAAMKIFNQNGAGSVLYAIAALDYAIAKGIRISNNSWTDSGYNSMLNDALRRAAAVGHIFVAAAGNQGRNTDVTPSYPAAYDYDNIISVGATDRQGRLASFSNFGKTSVDIVAPGVDILSTNPGKSYGNRSGTSMAVPQVAGTVALVWSLRPEWTHQQVIAWIKHTATQSSLTDGKVASGRLNASAAVRVPPRGSVLPSALTASVAQTGTSSGSLSPAGLTPSLLLAEYTAPHAVLDAALAGLLPHKEEKQLGW